MSLLTEESDEPEHLLVASIDNAKNVAQLLKAVNFRETAMVFATQNGLKVTVEDCKCVQANAFIQADMFNEFVLTEDAVSFRINLSVLLDCLYIFGSGGGGGGSNRSSGGSGGPALRMCYSAYGSPLSLILEEGGVITDCAIKTQDVEDILDFTLDNSAVMSKVIIQAECMKDVFSELDLSSDVLEITLSNQQPNFRMSTYGNAGSVHIDFPKDSDMIESFQCSAKSCHRYKLSLLKLASKPLHSAMKVSLRLDERGFLCLQYMIKTDDGHTCFVDFYCAPQEDVDGD